MELAVLRHSITLEYSQKPKTQFRALSLAWEHRESLGSEKRKTFPLAINRVIYLAFPWSLPLPPVHTLAHLESCKGGGAKQRGREKAWGRERALARGKRGEERKAKLGVTFALSVKAATTQTIRNYWNSAMKPAFVLLFLHLTLLTGVTLRHRSTHEQQLTWNCELIKVKKCAWIPGVALPCRADDVWPRSLCRGVSCVPSRPRSFSSRFSFSLAFAQRGREEGRRLDFFCVCRAGEGISVLEVSFRMFSKGAWRRKWCLVPNGLVRSRHSAPRGSSPRYVAAMDLFALALLTAIRYI